MYCFGYYTDGTELEMLSILMRGYFALSNQSYSCRFIALRQVETFGSVPLKTYLPDGDIDLTALSFHTDLKDTWAQDVVKALQVAEANADSQFRVKDVQYIRAEVRVVCFLL